jgi:NAD(P)-dependent dehydrogenase (short-subunit alcohol dehydrogenase family)
MSKLKDQVAIVTGGGGGLGEAICHCFAEEGADLVVSDLKRDLAEMVSKKVESMGRKSITIATDVRNSKDCQDLIEKTISRFGKIDILVCNAGVGGYAKRPDSDAPLIIENVREEEDWDYTIDVNLKGVFLCCQAAAPQFKKQRKGKIINISSIAGRKGADWLPHYSASKAGVIVLTQSIALQLAPYNINVNTVCPGVIWTPLWENEGSRVLSQAHPQFKGKPRQDIFDTLVRTMIPLGRPQTPESIAKAVLFFASSDADEITGQALNVDGGAVFN